MVEALCSEGENLRRSLEESRQRTQNASYLSSERAEALWEVVDEMHGAGERSRASGMLVRRLKKSASEAGSIAAAVGELAAAIDHMVVEARLEAKRVSEGTGSLKPVLDEIQKSLF